jgi:OPT oligopeptide transporter protein
MPDIVKTLFQPLYISAGFTIGFIAFFGAYSAAVVHIFLFNRHNVLDALKNTFSSKNRREQFTDIHCTLISRYSEVPQWWYATIFILSFVPAFVTLFVYVPESPKWVSLQFFVVLNR